MTLKYMSQNQAGMACTVCMYRKSLVRGTQYGERHFWTLNRG